MPESKNQSESTAGQSTNGAASGEEATTNLEPVTLEELSACVTELAAQQEELEIKLIRQEHRLIPAVQRVFTVYREGGDGSQAQKEQRLAALLALAENLIFRRVTTIIVASVIGLAGTLIAILTLFEFKDQNKAILEQNRLFQEQNQQQLVATNGQMVSELIGDLYEARKADSVQSDSNWDVPKPLVFRILSVSEALLPYDSAEISNDSYPDYSIRIVSRERGELLQALVAMCVGFPLNPSPNFSHSCLGNAYLPEANLEYSYLRDAKLRGANLQYANLRDTDLRGAFFTNADLWRANLRNSDLRDASLRNAYLRDADLPEANLEDANFRYSNLQGANLERAIVTNVQLDSARILSTADFQVNIAASGEPDSLVDFLSYAIEQGAIVVEEDE